VIRGGAVTPEALFTLASAAVIPGWLLLLAAPR
jgi:hypothetical protein